MRCEKPKETPHGFGDEIFGTVAHTKERPVKMIGMWKDKSTNSNPHFLCGGLTFIHQFSDETLICALNLFGFILGEAGFALYI